ncbi:GNAT family N-acetyltransferase [Candidatus Bipolaricaulota bacterium]|nr:GNAT family N-acetyltransferase [Candidatus Bipolaricaulota bacterium]
MEVMLTRLTGAADIAGLVGRALGRSCLKNGTKACIRVIEPEDVMGCAAMLSLCSPKSLYSRYERRVGESAEELAFSLCCPDAHCELTVVAEATRGTPLSLMRFDRVSGIPLLGVAQLITDSRHEAAEYAVLVADPWQSMGLGSALTDVCLRLAHAWNLERVVAEFLPSNMRMIHILESRRFDLQRTPQEHVVSGHKRIAPVGGWTSGCSLGSGAMSRKAGPAIAEGGPVG